MIGRLLTGLSGLALATAAIGQPADRAARAAAFDAALDTAEQTAWLRQMSSAPNHVGSPHDRANAEFVRDLYRSWGWDARIETFEVLYPTPVSTTLEMIAPVAVRLGGQEPPVPGDDSTTDLSRALPPYVAYQGDGDVTGDLVYVNYGMPDDYLELARRGIDVRGKIVIARYGGGWRGLKPKLAQDHGAIGCLIYSDPDDDGYRRGDTYPTGGFRPAGGVQRGSVQDMVLYPGDPLTPGVGATSGARRLPRGAAETLLKIVALPISYGDAQQLLARLGGAVVPAAMRGGLPIAYHFGGAGTVKVHLAVASDWSPKTLYDVIATLRGRDRPDEWVIRGNHRDGWVFGAADPLSGHVAMMAEGKALGTLVRQGWRPKRTIVHASWDGEEPGLLGSTEWAETHAAELQAKAVVYLNTDEIERGVFAAQGSHELQHLINEVAGDVPDPETGVSIRARQAAAALVSSWAGTGGRGSAPTTVAAAERGGDLPIGPLGSGSDYSAFGHHLGIPSVNLGFGGEGATAGVYHSAYDTFHHYVTFDDPGLRYVGALARVAGRAVMRLADDDTPPLRFSDLADTIAGYLDEIERLADGQRAADMRLAKLVATGAFRAATDPAEALAGPPAVAPTPFVELAALRNAVAHLRTGAAAYDAAYAARGAALSPAARQRLNAMLRPIDQLLLDARGLPGRPWYRNLIYAPGRLTGYGAKTLPGVREAIEQRRFADADLYAGRTAAVIDAYADRLDLARKVVDGRWRPPGVSAARPAPRRSRAARPGSRGPAASTVPPTSRTRGGAGRHCP